MSKICKIAAHSCGLALIAALSMIQLSASAEARKAGPSMGSQAMKAQAMRSQAASMRMAQMRRGQAAQAGMATALVTAATVASADAGECSPYLAKWMMTHNPAWKAQYDACMDD